MRNKRVLVIGPDNSTGFRVHLENISKIYPTGSFLSIKNRDDRDFERIIEFNPNLCIFGGKNWIIRNKHILKKLSCLKGVLFCSPLAQAEISQDEVKHLNIYLSWLDQELIDYLFCSSFNLYNVLRIKNKKVRYLPAPAILDHPNINNKIQGRVCILSDKAKHKNILNGLVSGLLSKEVEDIFINGLDENYRLLVEGYFPNHQKIKNKGWLSYKDYNRVIGESRLLIHLSFSESFCYTILEALYNGTLVLTNPVVDWIGLKELYIQNTGDVEHLVDKINYIMGLGEVEYNNLLKKAQSNARKTIEKHNQIVLKTLRDILI
jgi:hypothetical protein